MDSREKLCNETKKKIRSILTSSPYSCTISIFAKDYKTMLGEEIPFRRLGFTSLEQFLYSIPDVVRFIGRGPQAQMEPVISEKSAHINELVTAQKSNTKMPKRFGRAPRRRKQSPAHATPPPLCLRNIASCSVNNNSNNIATNRVATPAASPRIPLDTRNRTNNIAINKVNNNIVKNQTNVPIPIQNNLKKIIDDFPDGIWCTDLPLRYKEKIGTNLNYSTYGYRSLIDMCASMPAIFKFFRPGTEDFKLYPSSTQLPSQPSDSVTINPNKSVTDSTTNEPEITNDLDFCDYSLLLPKDIFRSKVIVRQFLPDNVNVNGSVNVVVAEIYDPSKFWVYLRDSPLDPLMDEMQLFYQEHHSRYEIPNLLIKEGMYCVQKYFNEFHRALVVGVVDDVKVRVFFIDYGTMISVPRKGICYLTEYFAKLPAQGIRCRLSNLRPVSLESVWPKETTNRFKQLLTKRNISAKISVIDRENEVIEVYLADTTDSRIMYINDVLIDEGLAVSCNQEQRRPLFTSNFRPISDSVHLFPTFNELEYGLVPSANETNQLIKDGVPVNFCLPLHFVERDEGISELDKELIGFIADKQKELDVMSESPIEHDYDFDVLKGEEMDFRVFGDMEEELRKFYKEIKDVEEGNHVWGEENGVDSDDKDENFIDSDETDENRTDSDEIEDFDELKTKESGLTDLLMGLELEEDEEEVSSSDSCSEMSEKSVQVSTNPFLNHSIEDEDTIVSSNTNPFLYDLEDELEKDVVEEDPKEDTSKETFVPSSLSNLLSGINLLNANTKNKNQINTDYELLISSSSSSTTDEIVPITKNTTEETMPLTKNLQEPKCIEPQEFRPPMPRENRFGPPPYGPPPMPYAPPVNYYREWIDMYGNCVQQMVTCTYNPNPGFFRPPVPYQAPNFGPRPIAPPPGFCHQNPPQNYDFYNNYNNKLMGNRFARP